MTVDPDRFLRDLLADAITVGLAHQWRERAQRFRDARPRRGDFHGQATREALSARWQRLTALAEACEAKADLIAAAERQDLDLLAPELEALPLLEAA